jgi:GxxExxY protein
MMTELPYRELTFKVIGAAMEVHRILGPGFLEVVYQGALERELNPRMIPFERKVKLRVVYKDVITGDYETDLVTGKKFVVKLKAISKLDSSHEAQAMHYLAAIGSRLALLLNFGTSSLDHRRIIK